MPGGSVQWRDVAQERCWRAAGELAEFLDQVCLIEVSAISRYVGPRKRACRPTLSFSGLDVGLTRGFVPSCLAECTEHAYRPIEAQQPRNRLGWQAHACPKSRDESAMTAIQFGDERAKRHAAVCDHELLPGYADRPRYLCFRYALGD